MRSTQRLGRSSDWMQLPLVVNMEASHVGCLCSPVGGIQDIEQVILIGQTDRTSPSGGKDACQREMPLMDVDDGNLITSGIYSEQPRPLARENQRSLRTISKGCQTAQPADRG